MTSRTVNKSVEWPNYDVTAAGATSAIEKNMLIVGTEDGIIEGALWSEKGARQTLFMKWVDGGDPVCGKQQSCVSTNDIDIRVYVK